MPELPDITVYIESLQSRILGRRLEKIRIVSPFLLRTFDPPLKILESKTVRGFHRIGKQIVWEFEGDYYLVFHLMIAGRLHWKKPGAKAGKKIYLAAFDFSDGTLLFTEASTKKRASLYLVRGRSDLAQFDRGGLEIFSASFEQFRDILRRENHTLKRALTDPRLFSAVGNAYSDEILHSARLSPLRLSRDVSDEEIHRLYSAAKEVLESWIKRLRR